MVSAPCARRGFFPLDEELGLLSGPLTPRLQEGLTRLATWMPFAQAGQMLTWFTRVSVSEATARRQTERAGAAYVALQAAEVARLEEEMPPAPLGPERQVMEVDGAFVPLLHREWGEVRTLALGRVGEPVWEGGEWVVHSEELSYFSRLASAESFGRQALWETQRRGTERAAAVAAVTDGAEWEQGFIDLHRADAVRILDFPHAMERVSALGEATREAGMLPIAESVKEQAKRLKEEGPTGMLAEWRRWAAVHPQAEGVAGHLAYLEKREAHMAYPAYLVAGWPIGSGAVESGNKLVVEARLKGAGMHWARLHVDPMLGLRNVVCSGRWEEAWPQISGALRAQQAAHRTAGRERRRAATAVAALGLLAAEEGVTAEPVAEEPPRPQPQPLPRPVAEARRPTAQHPWRRLPACSSGWRTHFPSHRAKS